MNSRRRLFDPINIEDINIEDNDELDSKSNLNSENESSLSDSSLPLSSASSDSEFTSSTPPAPPAPPSQTYSFPRPPRKPRPIYPYGIILCLLTLTVSILIYNYIIEISGTSADKRKAISKPKKVTPTYEIPKFQWPMIKEISSLYGWRHHPISKTRKFHSGIDLATKYYEPIYAMADGKIAWADWKGGKGKCVIIRHNEAFQTLYAHMVKIQVKKNKDIKKGDMIGYTGSTGYANGPHLHFEIHKLGTPIDPLVYLPRPSEVMLVRLNKEDGKAAIGGGE